MEKKQKNYARSIKNVVQGAEDKILQMCYQNNKSNVEFFVKNIVKNKTTVYNKIVKKYGKSLQLFYDKFNSKEENKHMKKNLGITLIALVITIVILIILATITVNLAFGEGGIIQRAQESKNLTEQGIIDEQEKLNSIVDFVEDIENGTTNKPEEPQKSEIEEAKDNETIFEENVSLEDKNGNKVPVPEGFKIANDSGNTVQEGIVIEDVTASTDKNIQGSQYVWIPVGTFKKDNGEMSNEIILGRYTFADDENGTPQLQQEAFIGETENYKTEKIINNYYVEYSGTHRDGIVDNSNHQNDLNASANDLELWMKSVKNNGGYYIARYEASFASGNSFTIGIDGYRAASKISNGHSETNMSYTSGTLWNNITQLDASKVAINTYNDNTNIQSDLINSYAWDTAIVYIQEAGNTNYSNKKSLNNELSDTGTNKDEVCKINDMVSNLGEWTTEYSKLISGDATPCTNRGGNYVGADYTTDFRDYNRVTYTDRGVGFRITLYFINNN